MNKLVAKSQNPFTPWGRVFSRRSSLFLLCFSCVNGKWKRKERSSEKNGGLRMEKRAKPSQLKRIKPRKVERVWPVCQPCQAIKRAEWQTKLDIARLVRLYLAELLGKATGKSYLFICATAHVWRGFCDWLSDFQISISNLNILSNRWKERVKGDTIFKIFLQYFYNKS